MALEENEFATIGLIYNHEVEALGDEAIYPVCLSMPAGTNKKQLLRYLRRASYPISDFSVCNPANGPFTPSKDYPHGMSINIDKVRRISADNLEITVAIGDNTMHFERDLGSILRNGTYHFQRRSSGEWELTWYTKQYDFRDKTAADTK